MLRHGLRLAYMLARGGERRRAALLLLRRPKGLFQPFADTRSDRYPEIFAFVRDGLADRPQPRLLSFGCSVGEEVFSLRQHFPAAHLRGLDIQAGRIARCRADRRVDERMSFAVAADTETEPPGHYDAIFAMAVFRHGDLNVAPPPPRCDHLIRFAEFERIVAGLARCLRPDGLLAIRHAHFRFEDTETARAFEPLLSLPPGSATDPLYGPDHRPLSQPEAVACVFRKLNRR